MLPGIAEHAADGVAEGDGGGGVGAGADEADGLDLVALAGEDEEGGGEHGCDVRLAHGGRVAGVADLVPLGEGDAVRVDLEWDGGGAAGLAELVGVRAVHQGVSFVRGF